jgi:YD repeat-containing protein
MLVKVKQVHYLITNGDTAMQSFVKGWSEKFPVDKLPDIYYAVPKTKMNVALPMTMYSPAKAGRIEVKTVKSSDPNQQDPQYDQNFDTEFDSLGYAVSYYGSGCTGCTYTPFKYKYTWSPKGKLLTVNSTENVNIVMSSETTVVQNEILRVKMKYDSLGRLVEMTYAEDKMNGWKMYFTYP